MIPPSVFRVLVEMAMDFRLSLARLVLLLVGLAYTEAFYIPGMCIDLELNILYPDLPMSTTAWR